MTYMKNLIRYAAAVMLIVILGAGVCMAESAAKFPSLDSTGSISVTIKDENGDPLPGGTLKLWKVADVVSDEGYKFKLTDEFADFTYPIASESDLNAEKAAQFEQFIDQKSIKEMKTAEIGEEGKASFAELPMGLYLVVQSEAAPKHIPVDPFLVSVPLNVNDAWVLDVDATPKPSGSELAGPTSYDPLLEKKVTGENAPETDFRFSFKRLNGGPMPINTSGNVVSADEDEIILQIKGAGKLEIGKITFTDPGKYTYLCTELNTGEENFTYDETEYWMEIEVKEGKTALEVSNVRITYGVNGSLYYEGTDREEAIFVFTNAYEEEPETPEPETPKETESETPKETEPETSKETEPVTSKETEPETSKETESETPKATEPETPKTTEKQTEPRKSVKPETPTKPGTPTTTSRLPQTGQLWWPVLALAAAGIVLIIIGAAVKRKRNG